MSRNVNNTSSTIAKINTTGDLRKFLADTISRVSGGEIGIDEASRITKLAAQINESFYSEVKIAKTKWEMGETVKVDLGNLPIG